MLAAVTPATAGLTQRALLGPRGRVRIAVTLPLLHAKTEKDMHSVKVRVTCERLVQLPQSKKVLAANPDLKFASFTFAFVHFQLQACK